MRRRKGFTAKALRRGDAKGCGRGGWEGAEIFTAKARRREDAKGYGCGGMRRRGDFNR